MSKVVNVQKTKTVRQEPPALTPEARESRIVAKAMDMAEELIDNRTASSQLLTHFLKLGTVRAELELEELRQKTELAKAKTREIDANKENIELLNEVMKCMREYQGMEVDYENDEYE